MPGPRPPQPTLTGSTLSEAVVQLTGRDPHLAYLVDEHGPPPLWARPPGFATLARIILEQQVSLASAAALFARLERELGEGMPPASVAAHGVDGLRRLGVTRQKARYLTALAGQVSSGELNLSDLECAPDDEVVARLTRLPGIGPWTASIYLLMALLRPDVWPENDLALHRMMARGHRDSGRFGAEDTLRGAEAWRPWRAVAARILWHGYLSGAAGRAAVPPA
jgi:DNA-3-methyladenine glycosylase II